MNEKKFFFILNKLSSFLWYSTNYIIKIWILEKLLREKYKNKNFFLYLM